MLNQAQMRQFNENGFLNAGQAVTPEEADLLSAEVLRVLDDRDNKEVPQPLSLHNMGTADAAVWQIVNIWEASEPFKKLLFNKMITEAASQLLRANEVRIWHDQIQYKPAQRGGVNMWHQDSVYWPTVAPKDQQVTAWLALDDADADNGCMSMVPHSHQWGDQIAFLHSLKGFDAMPKEHDGQALKVVLAPVKKGHVHFHHSLTWHGSQANTSGRPRRAIALHFMNERTVFVKGGGHLMERFVTSADGEKIAGEHFPLVWKKQSELAGV